MKSYSFVHSSLVYPSLSPQPSSVNGRCLRVPSVHGTSSVNHTQKRPVIRAAADVNSSDVVRSSETALPATSVADGKPCLNEEQTELLSEQMSVYFELNETTYQPGLSTFWKMGLQNFVVELDQIVSTLRRLVGIEPPNRFSPPDVLGLQLSNEAVVNRERERQNSQGEIKASWFVRTVYTVTCQLLDVVFDKRPIPRFWFLETVARMPYFAYSSCLHLYATLGWYRSPTMMNMHHAEELNEAYHLSIMESLGGDKFWSDRFLAYHASLLYYWFLVFLFIISPAESYRFSELLELHAVDTYVEFLETNEELLRELPVPDVALEYRANYMYYFQEFQTTSAENGKIGRENLNMTSLYDVFSNIVHDEIEHSKTMTACIGFLEKGDTIYYNGKRVEATSRGNKEVPASKRREFWEKWRTLTKRQNKN